MGCSSSSDDPPPNSVIEVNGDPNVFVKDTVMNLGEEEIPKDFFDTSMKYFVFVRGFVEAELAPIEKESETVESRVKQQTPLESQDDYLNALKEMTEKQTAKVVLGSNEASFESIGGGLDLTLVKFVKSESGGFSFNKKYLEDVSKADKTGSNIRLLHISVKKDETAVSVLFSGNSGGKRFVVAYEIQKREDLSLNLTFLDKAYKYMLGPGLRTGWSQDHSVELSTCEFISNPELSRSVSQGVAPWAAVLKNRLDLSEKIYKKCPPFSDLNFHGFYFIRDWIEVLGDYGVLGRASNSYDLRRGEIIDSDIFILLSEWDEGLSKQGVDVFKPGVLSSNPKVKEMMISTFIHEIGHFLGLHHQFDGTASVMSYEKGSRLHLTSYDKKAVQALYP